MGGTHSVEEWKELLGKASAGVVESLAEGWAGSPEGQRWIAVQEILRQLEARIAVLEAESAIRAGRERGLESRVAILEATP